MASHAYSSVLSRGVRVEGRGRRMKLGQPRHCGCERCTHGMRHLHLQAVHA